MEVEEFDAGTLACSDGLANVFRARMEHIPVGARLRAIVRDPSAKVDLPALTRMMGHEILDVVEHDDGRLEFLVERGA